MDMENMTPWKPGQERVSRRERRGQQTDGDILFEAVSMACAEQTVGA